MLETIGAANGNTTKEPGFLQAEEALVRKLMDSDLTCGQSLKESVLAKEFNINRPSVREALSQAVGWGVVEYIPYCGYRIKNFTLGDILDWNELRAGIEPVAARRLALQPSVTALEALEYYLAQSARAQQENDREKAISADMNFHMAIIAYCGNARFSSPNNLCYLSVLFRLNVKMCSEIYFRMLGNEEKYRDHNASNQQFLEFNDELIYDVHQKILQSIRQRDGNSAEHYTRYHIDSQVANLRKIIDLCVDPQLPLNSLYTRFRSFRKRDRQFFSDAIQS